MTNVTKLHPDLSAPEVIERGGVEYVNVPGVIEIARNGTTPQARALVRFYSAEWRSLDGKPISDKQRETDAFYAAWQRMVRKFSVPPLRLT